MLLCNCACIIFTVHYSTVVYDTCVCVCAVHGRNDEVGVAVVSANDLFAMEEKESDMLLTLVPHKALTDKDLYDKTTKDKPM